ncbi:M-phase phosphoprotein 8 [Colletotrichum sp. SAR 10_70]|nr:M-phase phosphoprotein 8 [Colletotrichum sp. SAR 10_71]KAI8181437.1 M-phase phosphoprotein 8 [Colletotrichum sp. SAR 10_70]KAI8184441.1 M-phase phosphoprotein 8 [Colletotrichum sp. SAR 10_75]KAI8228811.1 M-phase phosphoprotein 8 [Colletotrichum sp. SAR 10_86]
MSKQTVFKARDEPMTQEQLAALAAEAAQHAEQEADMGDDTIPQITSDIIPGIKNNSSDADDVAPAPKRKRGRPTLAPMKIKREDSVVRLDEVEAFQGGSSSQYGTPLGTPELPATSRVAGKAKRKFEQASANDTQKAGVTFISRAQAAKKSKNPKVDGHAINSDETEDDPKRQKEFEDDTERQNESENDGEEESVEGNDAVNDQEVPVQTPRRGRPRKNIAAAEADPPKRRGPGRPSKTQTPTTSSKATRGSIQSKRHRISARLKILEANRSVPADEKRSLRSSGKNTDATKKVSSSHTRGVAQVKKTPKKRPTAVRAESEDDEYEVERIVGVEPAKGKKQKKYEVKWKGYSNNENTMEPEENLANCKHLIAAFEKKQSKAVKK